MSHNSQGLGSGGDYWHFQAMMNDSQTLADERVLKAAIERAQRGEYASDAEMADLLDQPWS